MSINDCIRELGNLVKDRLDPEIVDYDLDYINHSENVLAFETLCDHLSDFNVKLNENEYEKILNIVKALDLKLDNRYLYLNPNK